MKAFTFDVVLTGTITVKGKFERDARRLISDTLVCADSNLGAWPDGEPILGELSLWRDVTPKLVAIDGEDPFVATQPYGGESLLGDGDRFRIFEEPARGFRVSRLSDGAEYYFHGDDGSEEFSRNFPGDEFALDPEDNRAAADEFGDWCEFKGYLPLMLRYCVDGHEFQNDESNLAGDGNFPPFRIFDIPAQDYLPGTYQVRSEAEQVCARLNGAPA